MSDRLARAALAAMFLAAPFAAQAVTVGTCDTRTANASNIVFPGDESLRSFAEGAIRFIWLDLGEPACCSSLLMVVVFHDVEMEQSCWLIAGDTPGPGFGGFDLRGAGARYDPSRGLTVTVPANIWANDVLPPATLDITINQATRSLTVTERPR